MKFVTFIKQNGQERAGVLLENDYVVDLHEASSGELPEKLLDFIEKNEEYMKKAEDYFFVSGEQKGIYQLNAIQLRAPLPLPRSFRDFYAFEQHVKTARGMRGLEMIPEWYDIPVFYFSNHLAIKGPGEIIPKPKDSHWLDYELEIACIIGKEGRDIRAEEADEFIFGYTILNDWSARDLQQKEMKVGLGPAKGKDFSTSIGPWIVTKEDLEPLRAGKGYDISMKARVNGVLLSEGNMKDIYYSFAEMIERASRGVTLYPGEILGSGTVGTGCILELGEDVHRWLEPGDVVELEVDHLGVLNNIIE
ncbi:fumarylacetoacetate hydrolase family protein [Neobacillus massiliamazoniensis]|jgi:2-keto-4-pentenoate hydratase/2-oxohepta-3-ene-1,7-dioic acid hydratase in catechol pathway|uniref:Fumarylacetoacetate hydrolase family protein n=1 Tax=Neobacillus massiliamazoniensis TaxID=1499688 RepID=A0A0U1P0S4_9BACI|nr:fumarylacetoacetate hydrolase family protein [Neobacillus massiliamazoniensis]CRK83708.1 fumarylacetoacetate hydrolase family protein [Neobacillus massiliamazoniensis]